MSSIEQAIRRVQMFVEFPGWSPFKLSKAAKLGYSTLQNMSAKDWSPDTKTLEACLAVVDKEVAKMKGLLTKFEAIGAKKS